MKQEEKQDCKIRYVERVFRNKDYAFPIPDTGGIMPIEIPKTKAIQQSIQCQEKKQLT